MAVAVYARGHKMGGMAHISRGEKEDDLPDENLHQYADHAVAALVRILCARIMGQTATGRDFTACIAGGGDMFEGLLSAYPDVGGANVKAVKSALDAHHITLVGEDILGGLGRSMWFDLSTGNVRVSCAGQPDILLGQ